MSTLLEQQARELATRLVMLPVNNVSRQLDAFEALILKELQRVRDEGARDTKRYLWALDHPSEFEKVVCLISWGPDAALNKLKADTAIDAAMRPTKEREET